MSSSSSSLFCSHCSTGLHIVYDDTHGVDVCSNCGFVIKENRLISTVESYRQVSRAGYHGDVRNPHLQLGSYINEKQKSKGFYRMPHAEKMNNLTYAHAVVTQDHREKTTSEIFKVFDELKETHGLSELCISIAKRIWNLMGSSQDIIKGSKREGVKAACIYCACRITKFWLKQDVVKMFKIKHNVLLEGEKRILNKLLLLGEHQLYKEITQNAWKVQQQETITREAELLTSQLIKLELDFKKYNKLCLLILNTCRDDLFAIETTSLIAGVISFIVHEHFKEKIPSKKKIVESLEITPPTLSNALRIIRSSVQKHHEELGKLSST